MFTSRRFARDTQAPVLICALLLASSAVEAAERVVIFDVQTDGVSGSDVAQLPDLMGQIIASHEGFEVVPDADTHRALLDRQARRPDCAESEACRWRIVKDLHAKYMIYASLVKRERTYALYVSLTDVVSASAPAKTSETMKLLKSLPLNAKLCLGRLFQWKDAPPAVTTQVATSTPTPPAPEARPSVEEPAPAPAPGLAATEVAPASTHPTPGVKRVMVLDLRAIDVEAAAVAPFASLIAGQIAAHPGFDVASADDVHRMMEQQVQKQVGGCTQDDACLVEISRKLSADLIVSGTLGKVGKSYVLTLGTLNPADMKSNRRASETADRAQELIKALPGCLDRLFHWGKATGATFHLPKGKSLSFAVFDLKPTGLSPETAANLTQVLTTEVKGIEGATVVSRDDITAMLQLESSRMKAGCDDAGCMAEIGGALGVDRLITGDAGKVGTLYIVNLRLLDVRHGVVENRVTESFEGTEEQLLRAVRFAARNLLGLKAAAKGQLAITASQNAADVFVDDSTSGKAPAHVVDLVPGKHAVRVATGGFFDWHGDVYVDPLETTSIWAELNARPQAWFQKWWVWTIVGGVVAAATATAVVETQKPPKTGGGTVYAPQ